MNVTMIVIPENLNNPDNAAKIEKLLESVEETSVNPDYKRVVDEIINLGEAEFAERLYFGG